MHLDANEIDGNLLIGFWAIAGSKEEKISSKQIRIQVNNMAHSSGHTERSIHEMLKDTPSMNESNSAIHSGIEGRIKHPNSLHIRTNSGEFWWKSNRTKSKIPNTCV